MAQPHASAEESFSRCFQLNWGQLGLPLLSRLQGLGTHAHSHARHCGPSTGYPHGRPALPTPAAAAARSRLHLPLLLVPLPPKYPSVGPRGQALPVMDWGCQRQGTGNSRSVTPPC